MTTAKKVQPEATLRSINMAYPSSVELASSLPERHRFHQQTGLFPLLSFAWEPSNQKKTKKHKHGDEKDGRAVVNSLAYSNLGGSSNQILRRDPLLYIHMETTACAFSVVNA